VKMWSGRFRQPLDPQFEQWQRSFPFDQKLLRYELAASRAHALALGAAGVLSGEECNLIIVGLEQIERNSDQENFFADDEAEDVHHFVEKQLVALIGETGKKLHSGRSRNEQIATDLRLFVRESIDDLRAALGEFLETLLTRAGESKSAAMPAYTHLQRAEPVLVAHWLLAYFEMFWRDAERLHDCRKRLNQCPLGSGAVAGAPLALDRDRTSDQLGFDRPTANSMDATSDRDFALEFSSVAALLGVHLSRWAEELILFATQEYGFIRLPEAYSTGSSAMPQKQNPDSLELIRGKSARLIGCQVTLLTAVKGGSASGLQQGHAGDAGALVGRRGHGGRLCANRQRLHAAGHLQLRPNARRLRKRFHERPGGSHVSRQTRRPVPRGPLRRGPCRPTLCEQRLRAPGFVSRRVA
jgi:argininosuccinate lyase